MRGGAGSVGGGLGGAGLVVRCWNTDLGMIATEGMFATEGAMASEGRLAAALATPSRETPPGASASAPGRISPVPTPVCSRSPSRPSPKVTRASAPPSPSLSCVSHPADAPPALPPDVAASTVSLSTSLLHHHHHRRHHSHSSSPAEKLL